MDSKELKKHIFDADKVEFVLEEIGMHSIRNYGDYFVCGFPDGDNSTGCTVYKSEYINIKSYTRNIENEHGFQPDIIDLVSFLYNIKPFEAMVKLAEIVGLRTAIGKNTTSVELDGLEVFRKAKKRNDVRKLDNGFNARVLDQYDRTIHIDLVHKDWITPQIAEKYAICYDYETDRILFPHFKHDDKDVVLAVIGRTIHPSYEVLKIPKYLTILGVGYNKGNNLYGLSHNRERILKEKKIIIFESEKSVIKADQCGYGFGVSVGCHTLTMEQIKLILSLGVEEIIFAFDKDVSLEEVKKYSSLLNSYVKVSCIYDKWDLLSHKDSPVDKGIKRFRFLYNNRLIM